MTHAFGHTSALCAGLALAGCVSVLPRAKPVDLYRFEPATAHAAASSAARSVSVLLSNGNFAPEAAGDRMVAVTAGQVAYVAGVRWAAPAETLFREAVGEVFEEQAGSARLLRRGDPGAVDYVLSLDVDHFETQFRAGRATAPTVMVTFHALLVRTRDHSVVGENRFQAQVLAAGDRVSAVVPAYDQALSETLVSLSGWVQGRVAQSG